jgi:hypothetical protein
MTATDRLAGLVSPVAEDFVPLAPAPRPAGLEGRSVGLADSMLNRRAGWGAGIHDAVTAALAARWPRCSTDRIARPQLGVHEPDRWAAAMAAKHAAIVIAVGD